MYDSRYEGMFSAQKIKQAQARMESARNLFDSQWSELADLVLPTQSGQFYGQSRQQGSSQTNRQYDEYASQALQDGVSTFEGLTMPRGQKWQRFRAMPDQLMESVEVQQWFERQVNLVFSMRNDPKSGFTTNVHTSSEGLMGFGNQSMWVDKRFDAFGRFEGLSYESEHIGGVWVERDARGNIFRIHRKITLTAEQAKDKWQDAAPDSVLNALKGPNPTPDRTLDFLHVIERNDAMIAGRLDAWGKPWKACYYCVTDSDVFLVGGYRTLRRIYSCFARSQNEAYGRGPAGLVLPAIRASQVIMQDLVLGTEMTVKPPLLAEDDDLDQAVIALGPFGITYGGLEMGRERLKTFLGTIDLSGAERLLDRIHAVIDKAFYRDLMQINRELKTHISAARTLEEVSEKGILLSPLARQEQEWFSPVLDVELDLLGEQGFFNDMPGQLRDYFANNGGVHVVYDNNLSRMQEANEAAGYLNTANQVGAIAQFDPGAVAVFIREYPLEKVIPGLGDVNGIPAKWRSTDDEKQQHDAEQRNEAILQRVLQAAPVLAQSAKDAAQAGAVDGA